MPSKRVRNKDVELERQRRRDKHKKGLCAICGLPSGTWFVKSTGKIKQRYRCVDCNELQYERVRNRNATKNA